MLSVNLGPIGISLNQFLLISGALAAAIVGHVIGRRQRAGIVNVLADMLLAGIVVARVVFVLRWFGVYRAAPLSILDIRDGGFTLPAGIAAALLVAVWHYRRKPVLRRPLAFGLAAGALVWGGAFLVFPQTEKPPMPTVSLQTLAGAPATLNAIAAGKPAVVNMWATWCPPCQREMPVLAAAQQREKDVVFVFASHRENALAVREYLESRQLALDNVLLDPTGQLGRAVGSRVLPTTLFYDANGKLADTHIGELSSASLAAKLNRIRTAP